MWRYIEKERSTASDVKGNLPYEEEIIDKYYSRLTEYQRLLLGFGAMLLRLVQVSGIFFFRKARCRQKGLVIREHGRKVKGRGLAGRPKTPEGSGEKSRAKRSSLQQFGRNGLILGHFESKKQKSLRNS